MDLHVALELTYMRPGLKVCLEPDAFYRLVLELQGKSPTSPISEADFNSSEVRINTAAGLLIVLKDESLGRCGYVKAFK